jgi:hypothetical protein
VCTITAAFRDEHPSFTLAAQWCKLLNELGLANGGWKYSRILQKPLEERQGEPGLGAEPKCVPPGIEQDGAPFAL